MAKHSPALVNFNAGELSPDLGARVDVDKYVRGGSVLSRYTPRVQGPSRRSPGTRYVTAANTLKPLIRKFIFSQGQAYVIEFGPSYARFYSNHAQVTSGFLNLPYQIATPFTSVFNADGTPALQIEQSGDVLYIASGYYWPMQLTRLGNTNWTLVPYQPPDGPFLEENNTSSPALYVVPISGSPGVYDCYATAPTFSASDVATASLPGRLVRIDAQWFNTPPWTSGNGIGGANVYRRYNGNTYVSLNANTTGASPPIHTQGVAWDGSAGVQWLYTDSGYGIGQVTSFISSTHVQVTATYIAGQGPNLNANQQFLFPQFVQGTTATITAITQASSAVVTFSGAVPVGLIVGDPLYLTNVGGMTQISERMFTVTGVSATTATLNVDSSGYSVFTSGGTGIRNASLNWRLGAWGSPSAQTPGGYPTVVCLQYDRLFWGGGVNGISWWGSCPGAYTSHAVDLFSQVSAACAVSGIIASQEVDAISWMSPAFLLLIGTKGGEFALGPITTTEPVGPGNTSVERQSKIRGREVKPELIGTTNFYVQLGGKRIYAQDYNFYLNRYDSTNQNRLANHILGYTVSQGCIDMAYHAEPYETLWCLRSDGILVGYTVSRQDDVTGWHEQPQAATRAGASVVVSMAVIPAPDGTRDELWLAVQRTINGVTACYIEYVEKDFETGDAQASQCYLDSSVQFTNYNGGTVSGLTWLAGEVVGIMLNGGWIGTATVDNTGKVTLPQAASGATLQIGLPYASTLTTMDIEGGADVGTAQGKMRRPNSVVVRLKNTLGAQVRVEPAAAIESPPAPPFEDLIVYPPNLTPLGGPFPLFTGDSDPVTLPSDSARQCKITVQNITGYQTEVLGIFPNITVQESSPP